MGKKNTSGATYDAIRDMTFTGDVVAFASRVFPSPAGLFTAAIRLRTGPITHVGIVLETYDSQQNRIVWLAEAGTRGGYSGIMVSPLSQRIAEASGSVYVLHLASTYRLGVSFPVLEMWAWEQRRNRIKYDFWGAMKSGLRLFRASEDFKHLFCSEYVAAAHRGAGGLPDNVNPSEVTPMDMCRLRMYEIAWRVKGRRDYIPGFNTVEPEEWRDRD